MTRAQNSSATTLWVHDAFGNLAAESTTGTFTAPCTPCYVSWDHLGSTRMVTDQNGTVVSRHDYLAYGIEIPAGINGRSSTWGAADYLSAKYTSAEHDSETVLDYMNARHFSGAQGRFMQADPANAGADLTNPQSFNMYGYALNNPMAFADPSGAFVVPSGSDPCEADTCVNVTDTASDWPTLPSVPPGSCIYLILDNSPQTVCGANVPTVTVYAKTPKAPG